MYIFSSIIVHILMHLYPIMTSVSYLLSQWGCWTHINRTFVSLNKIDLYYLWPAVRSRSREGSIVFNWNINQRRLHWQKGSCLSYCVKPALLTCQFQLPIKWWINRKTRLCSSPLKPSLFTAFFTTGLIFILFSDVLFVRLNLFLRVLRFTHFLLQHRFVTMVTRNKRSCTCTHHWMIYIPSVYVYYEIAVVDSFYWKKFSSWLIVYDITSCFTQCW